MVYSVGFAQVALARHSKSKLFLYTRLLATFSVLCILFLLLTPSGSSSPHEEQCLFMFTVPLFKEGRAEHCAAEGVRRVTFDLLLQNSSITKLCFVIPTERSDEESLLLKRDFSHLFEMTSTRLSLLSPLLFALCSLLSSFSFNPTSWA